MACANLAANGDMISPRASTRERADRGARGGGAVLDAELHEHLLEMLVDSARADVEDFADVAVRLDLESRVLRSDMLSPSSIEAFAR